MNRSNRDYHFLNTKRRKKMPKKKGIHKVEKAALKLTKAMAKYKWTFALGTTSRVPNSPLHYLILDIDQELTWKNIAGIKHYARHFFVEKTTNGYHVYTDCRLTFKQMQMAFLACGADPSWSRIGQRRGYWFLADKDQIILPWPVERMALHYDPKKGKKKDS
jgi:hypothetical protein